MSYIPALALGGERALTLWTMISGWAATALLFTLTRRFLDLRWSLALALIFLTTPAVLYGGGNGQVEIRNALFVMVAAFAVAQALKTGLLRYAVLAGLAAGFFMATKYLGLLFVAAAGLVILAQKKWFMHGAVFLLAALIAGGQWYIWNYTHTGDPVFPMLYGMLDYLNPDYWNTAYQQIFETLFRLDKAVPANSLWFFAYPFAATFGLYDVFESGRTGMGPFVLLALLFATFGLWRFRGHLIRSPLLPVAVLAGIFYGLWFFTASSQRVRHLLPVYPLVLLCVMVAAHRWATETGHLKPLAGAVLLTCLIQLAGQAVFGMSYGRYVLTGETREAFLLRTVRGYAPVPWINKNLGKNDLIYTQERQLIYLFDVPVYYGHWALDARIDTRPAADDPVKFFRQLTAQSISHLLVQGEMPAPGRYDRSKAKGYGLWRELAVRGCLETVKSIKGPSFGSRTLKTMVTNTTFHILKLKSPACLDNEKAPRL
ncbi:MAG: glycosyltransferase family 39 protein [Rhodospirillales bacterium]